MDLHIAIVELDHTLSVYRQNLRVAMDEKQEERVDELAEGCESLDYALDILKAVARE